MSDSNPDVTAADIITDVEARLASPNLSATIYLPWISYAYQRTFQAISKVGQLAREQIFGDVDTIDLGIDSPNEFVITDEIPRYGGIIKVEVKYGATGDVYNPAKYLRTVAHWRNMDNISTNYQGKTAPLYYLLGTKIGFIPVPPETGAVARVYFVKRPYQITDSTDVIDIPYRFQWPISEYVHAKGLQKVNEDYGAASALEANFNNMLQDLEVAVASEFNENDGVQAVESSAVDQLYNDPLSF